MEENTKELVILFIISKKYTFSLYTRSIKRASIANNEKESSLPHKFPFKKG